MADPIRVLEQALSLAPNERAKIARQLIASLEQPDEDIEAAWGDEIRRRIDEIESGNAEVESWEQVQRHLRAAVRNKA